MGNGSYCPASAKPQAADLFSFVFTIGNMPSQFAAWQNGTDNRLSVRFCLENRQSSVKRGKRNAKNDAGIKFAGELFQFDPHP
jgi:hypothetical protein